MLVPGVSLLVVEMSLLGSSGQHWNRVISSHLLMEGENALSWWLFPKTGWYFLLEVQSLPSLMLYVVLNGFTVQQLQIHFAHGALTWPWGQLIKKFRFSCPIALLWLLVQLCGSLLCCNKDLKYVSNIINNNIDI